jgi:hypothetical protein
MRAMPQRLGPTHGTTATPPSQRLTASATAANDVAAASPYLRRCRH